VRVDRAAVGFGDLDLVDAPQVDAAVAARRDAQLGLDVEVFKLRDGAEVRAVAVLAVRSLLPTLGRFHAAAI